MGRLLLLGLVAFCVGCARPGADRLVVAGLGQVDRRDLTLVRDDLSTFFGVPAEIRPVDLAEPPLVGGQMDAAALLTKAEALPLARGERLVLLVGADGGQPGLTFVLGLARRRGRCALVFTPRLRQGVDPTRYDRRLLTETHHELGHAYGLDHCGQAGCAMNLSATLADVDAKRPELCERCRQLLRRWRHRDGR